MKHRRVEFNRHQTDPRRNAFTLSELLVIIATLAATL